ncbi:MAG: ABC transporter ATP-binding protein [Butyribacter sp.]|nr:ABC transporter ATP-binding protein [Butyribacter sp.]
MRESAEKDADYTGINRIFQSKMLQKAISYLSDGTYRDFVKDWRWIFSYSKKYWKIVVFYTVLGVSSTTLGLGSAVLSKYVIDIITTYKTDKLWLLILVMVGSMAFSLVFSSLVDRYSLKLDIYVHNDIQAEVFDKIIDADWSKLTEYPNGDLLNRFNNDVGTISGNAVSWIPNVLISIYSFVATFIVILHYDVVMAFISFMSAPALLACSRFLIRKNREYQKRVMEMNSGMMSFETETFYNFDTIKSFGVSAHYSDQLRKWQEKYKRFNLEYNLFSIKRNIGLSLLSAGVGFVAFAYCLYLLWSHSITYGTMTLFLAQRTSLSNTFDKIIGIIPGMINSTVSAQRIRELVEIPKEIHDKAATEKMKTYEEDGFSVQLKEVDFSYRENCLVLRNSNFIARPNEIVAVVGPSGEGKTTMLRMILGLIHPKQGQAVLVARDGTCVDINADMRIFFSYVPQGNTILSGSIAENLRMVKEDATETEIIEALKIACAWDFVKELPEGIHDKLGERGHGISEGQAQRLAIARAVLRNRPILMLDEATSALDVETERQVLRNIICQRPNKTCIVTTHRPSVLSMCRRVYRVMDGEITELSQEQAGKMVQDF